MSNIESIIASIGAGEFTQSELSSIQRACQARRQYEGEIAMAGVSFGHLVRVKPDAKPEYIAGKLCVCTGRKGNKIMVRFGDNDHHYNRNGRDVLQGEWRMPASILEVEPMPDPHAGNDVIDAPELPVMTALEAYIAAKIEAARLARIAGTS